MITFCKTNPLEIQQKYSSSFHNDAIYFKVQNNKKFLCFYGVIKREDDIGEAFWIIKSFNGHVFTKEFFIELFKHASSLGFKELYTWTKCYRLINLFHKFKNFGIEKVDPPYWDGNESKSWFMKRI